MDYTTDFVLEEISDESQRLQIEECIQKGDIIVIDTSNDLISISELYLEISPLSFADCSVLYHAIKRNGTLLSGDKALRIQARKREVKVHGVIFVLDQLLLEHKIEKSDALTVLDMLKKLNPRLPKDIIMKRMKIWKL